MPDEPVKVTEEPAEATVAEEPAVATTTDPPPDGGWDQHLVTLWSPRRPRVVVKADLLPALSIVSAVSVLGLPFGWLWSRLAPAQSVRVYPGGQLAPLPLEGYHSFDDFAIFALMTLGAGLLTGFVLWRMRSRRGPVMLIAVVLGSAVAAWLAMRIGLSLAASHYPVSPAKVGSTVVRAPQLSSPWLLIVQPLAAALSYGTAAAWCGMDDLGRRRD